jgi:hypothetical protein
MLWPIGCAGLVESGRDMRPVADLEMGRGEKTGFDFMPLAGRVGRDIRVVYLTLRWIGRAGRVGFGRDMRAVAALEEGKGEKTAVDFACLAGIEGEAHMQEPFRGLMFWRAVCNSYWMLLN